MKTIITLFNTYLLFFTSLNSLIAQNNKVIHIPLQAENWEYKSVTVAFLEYKSKKAMKLNTDGDMAVLKDFTFIDGIIEFDMEPLEPGFSSIYFRWKMFRKTKFSISEPGKQAIHRPWSLLSMHQLFVV